MTNTIARRSSPPSSASAWGWRQLLERAGYGPLAELISNGQQDVEQSPRTSGHSSTPWILQFPETSDFDPSDVVRATVCGFQVVGPRPIDGGHASRPTDGADLDHASIDGRPVFSVSPDRRTIMCSIDLPRWCAWLLRREEELSNPEASPEANASRLDAHGRFCKDASILDRHGVLEIPVIDVWAKALRLAIESAQWALPRVDLVPADSNGTPGWACVSTHDVDHIDHVARKPAACLRPTWRSRVADRMGRGLAAGRRAIRAWAEYESELDWRGTWFFLGQREGTVNRAYEASDDAIRDEMSRLRTAGHEIGLHGSYDAMDAPELLESERDRIANLAGCELHGIRMHYLRYRHPDTADAIAAAGFQYDTSLGYTPALGFRCGTSVPFPHASSLREDSPGIARRDPLMLAPFSMMDCSFFSSLKMSLEEACGAMRGQMNMLRDLGGVGMLLFHPCRLTTDGDNYDALFRFGLRCARELGVTSLSGFELATRAAERGSVRLECVSADGDPQFRWSGGIAPSQLSVVPPPGHVIDDHGDGFTVRRGRR